MVTCAQRSCETVLLENERHPEHVTVPDDCLSVRGEGKPSAVWSSYWSTMIEASASAYREDVWRQAHMIVFRATYYGLSSAATCPQVGEDVQAGTPARGRGRAVRHRALSTQGGMSEVSLEASSCGASLRGQYGQVEAEGRP